MRVLCFFLLALVGSVAIGGVLAFYFLYTPNPAMPPLSGRLSQGMIESGGLRRTYLSYMPRDISAGAALLIAMHGSGESGRRMRLSTGYWFERLADQHGFAVLYPDGFEGYWNACNVVGDYAANKRNIDDVAFLNALSAKVAAEHAVDPARVFAVGLSRGGHMAYRLALEAPSRFRAVAAIAASVPTPDNFKCKPQGPATSSVMIMNGTADPLNPFEGGEVQLFGLIPRGAVRSSRASAQYFAGLNGIASAPQSSMSDAAEGIRVERVIWRNGSPIEVELVALHGGGHAIPQPTWRSPRILGHTAREPNGPAVIWDFFARQRSLGTASRAVGVKESLQ